MENLANETHLDPSNGNKPSFKERATIFLAVFIPKKDYYVTPILLALNTAIFLLMVLTGINFMAPTSEDLISWGANYRPLTLEGEPWRLLSCCFLHIGVIHLLLNMYALSSIGILLEPLLGKRNFIIAYLLTGIAASTTSLWWHDNTVSAGASGAIFGIYGMFTAMLTTNLINKEERQAQLKSMLVFIGYNLIFGLNGNIDNSAHIGGLVSGILLGYGFYFILKNKQNGNTSNFLLAGCIILVLISVSFVYLRLPNDMGKYYTKMEEFYKLEGNAVAFYNLPENSSNEKYLSTIKQGIVEWKKAKSNSEEIEKLDISSQLKEKNKLFASYADLRIQTFQLIGKAIEENTPVYDEQVKVLNLEIDEKIKQITEFK